MCWGNLLDSFALSSGLPLHGSWQMAPRLLCNQSICPLMSDLQERRRAAQSQQHHGGSLPSFIRVALGGQPSFEESSPCPHMWHSQKLPPPREAESFSRAEGSLYQQPSQPTCRGRGSWLITQRFHCCYWASALHTHIDHTSVFVFVT